MSSRGLRAQFRPSVVPLAVPALPLQNPLLRRRAVARSKGHRVPASPTDIPALPQQPPLPTVHDQPTLTVCVGLPASGKTYWAVNQLNRAFHASHRGRLWRSNRDDYRRMMLDPAYGRPPVRDIEDVITTIQYQQIHLLLSGGAHVICDDTNLNVDYCRRLVTLAGTAGAFVKVQDFTHVPLDICIARDTLRGHAPGYVGETVIREMHARYIAPHTGDDTHPCVKMIRAAGGLPVGG